MPFVLKLSAKNTEGCKPTMKFSNILKQVKMKSVKLLLFTLFCSFVSPPTPAFAIVEGVQSSHSIQSKVLVKKKTSPFGEFIAHFLGLNRISEREALVMGILSLVLGGLCGLYLLTHSIGLSKGELSSEFFKGANSKSLSTWNKRKLLPLEKRLEVNGF